MKIGRIVIAGSLVAAALAGVALAGLSSRDRSKTARLTVTEVEYKLRLSTAHLSAGNITLVVVNRGKLAHSLSISGPGMRRRLINGTVAPGATRTISVTLKSGSFSLWCPVPGHAALGMRTSLTVAGSSATGGATTTKTTTTTWG